MAGEPTNAGICMPASTPNLTVPTRHDGGENWPNNWPADPDLVPDWRVRQEARAKEIGLELPAYRTRRQWDETVAACTKPRPCHPLPEPLPALLPSQAAAGFLAWIRAEGRCGTYSHEAMTALYSEHCAASGYQPTHENFLRMALATYQGVSKVQIKAKHANGRRKRSYEWIISPAESVVPRVRFAA